MSLEERNPEIDTDKKSSGISSGVKVGLIAIAINIITVGVYIYQTNLMQKQQHASVWPHIEWRTVYNQNDGFTLEVMNNGVGPALIKKNTMRLNGEPVTSIDSLCSKLLGTIRFPHLTGKVANRVLPPGATVPLLMSEDMYWAEMLYSKFGSNNLEMEICYESIYGDQWRSFGTSVIEGNCN